MDDLDFSLNDVEHAAKEVASTGAALTLRLIRAIRERDAEIERLRYAASNALYFIPTNTEHEETCVRIIKEALNHD